MKYDLINVNTGKQEVIHDPDLLQKAVLDGTHAFPKGQWVKAFDEYGDYWEIPAEEARDALGNGYRIATPTQIAVQNYVEDNRGLKGMSKVLLGQFADEAAMGIPEIIMNATADPLAVAKKDALKKEHEIANTIGGVGGFGASLFLGGPLFKAGAKAGAGAVALRKKVTANVAEKLAAKGMGKRESFKHARGIIDKLMPYETMDKALAAAVEGGVVTSPLALTEAALGDYETAGEHVLAGVGLGAAFGAGGHLASKLFKAGMDKTGADDLLNTIRQLETSDGLKSLAGQQALEALGIRTGQLEKLKLMKTVEKVRPDGKVTYTNVPLTLKERHEFFREAGEALLDTKAMTAWSTNAKIERNIDDLLVESGERIGQAFKEADDKFGERVLIRPKTIAEQMKAPGGLLDDVMRNYAASTADENKILRVIKKLEGGMDAQDLKKLQKDEIDIVKGFISQVDEDIAKGIEQARKKLPGKVGDDLTPDNLALKRESIKAAKDHIKQYYGFNNKASKIDDTLQDYFAAVGYKPVNKTWKNIRDDLDEIDGVLGQTDDFIAGMKAEQKEAYEDLAEVTSADYVGTYQKVLTLQQANQVKAQFQRRIKQIGRQTDQFLPDAYQEVGKYFNREIRRVLGLAAGPEEVKKIVDLQRKHGNLVELLKPAQKANTKSISLNDLNPMTYASSGIGGIVGGALGGGVGAVIGAAAGAGAREILRRYGNQWLAVLLNNKSAGKLAAEYIIKNGAAKQYDRIPGILDNLAKGSFKPGLSTAKALPLLGVARLIGDDAKDIADNNKAEYIRKASEKLSILLASPAAAEDAINKLASPLINGGAPNIGEALFFKAMDAMRYLQEQMPKPPNPDNPFAPNIPWIPSDYEMASFSRKVNVVMDPLKTIMDEWENNTLMRDHIEALKAVYPQIHQQLKQKVIDHATKGEAKPLPYQARAKLSLIMGAPMDGTFSAQQIQYYQQSFLDQEAQDQGEIKAQVNVAENHMTTSQRIR